MSEGGNAPRLATAFGAVVASNFTVMGVQLLYSAFTGRVLPPSAFGAYAVALSGVGFVALISGGSLGQAVARLERDDARHEVGLLSLAGGLGLVAMVLVIVFAPVWGSMWGVPESVKTTRVVALGLPFIATTSVLAGSLRRKDRTPIVALAFGASQVIGVAVGLGAVMAVKQAWVLGVPAVVTQMGFFVGLLLLIDPSRRRISVPRGVGASLRYSAKSAGVDLIRNANFLLAGWGSGRFVGPTALGGFNRSITLLTVPMQSLHLAASYALFPEFRRGDARLRESVVMTDLLVLVAWPSFMVASLGALAAEPLLVVLLGPNWGFLGALPAMALLIGLMPMLVAPLTAEAGASARFRTTTLVSTVSLILVGIGVAVTAATRSASPAMAGLLAGSAVEATGLLLAGFRVGVAHGRRYLRQILPVVVGQIPVLSACLALFCLPVTQGSPGMQLLVVALVGVLELLVLWAFWKRTPLAGIAGTYRIPILSSLIKK